jgi:tRNA A37 methylthiotransferase MiaB
MEACRVVKFLKVNNWKVTPVINKADLVFFYGCGFNSDAEEFSLSELQLINKLKKKEAALIACGCLPGINKKINSNGLFTDYITRSSLDRIDEIVNSDISIINIKEPNDLAPYQFIRAWRKHSNDGSLNKKLSNILKKLKNKDLDYFKYFPKTKWSLRKIDYNRCHSRNLLVKSSQNINKNETTKFYIRTSTGCMSECSYCAIKHVTGPLTSKPLEKIITEFHEGLSKGYKTFYLLGEDVGAYGQDIGLSIVDLLNSLFKIDEKFKLEIHDFSPKWLIEYYPSLSQILSNNHDRIGLLEFPIQSGSEKIIKLMNRDYSTTELKKCLISLKEILPDTNLWTHVIIGFPGEDSSDFNDTVDFLNSVKFDAIFIYRYSDRPETKASELNHKIFNDVIERRIHTLKNQLTMHIPQTNIFCPSPHKYYPKNKLQPL